MIHKIIFGLPLLLLACTNNTQVPPIVTAQPSDIASVISSLAPMYNVVSPDDYVTVGENIVNASRCNTYFGKLAAKSNSIVQEQSQISLLGAAAGGAIGLAGGPVGAAAGTAMGAGLLNGFLGTSSADLGGSPPVATYGLTRQGMQQFQINSPRPNSLAEAAALVELHGELCSPVAAQLLAMQAITTAQTGPLAQPASAQPFGVRSYAASSRFVPPVIVVTPRQAQTSEFIDEPVPPRAQRRVHRPTKSYSSTAPTPLPTPNVGGTLNYYDPSWVDRQKLLKSTMTYIPALDGPKPTPDNYY